MRGIYQDVTQKQRRERLSETHSDELRENLKPHVWHAFNAPPPAGTEENAMSRFPLHTEEYEDALHSFICFVCVEKSFDDKFGGFPLIRPVSTVAVILPTVVHACLQRTSLNGLLLNS